MWLATWGGSLPGQLRYELALGISESQPPDRKIGFWSFVVPRSATFSITRQEWFYKYPSRHNHFRWTTFSGSIAMIVFTSSHCTGPPSISSSSNVDSSVASVHHSLPTPLKAALSLQVRVSSLEKTLRSTNIRRNMVKTSVYKMLSIDWPTAITWRSSNGVWKSCLKRSQMIIPSLLYRTSYPKPLYYYTSRTSSPFIAEMVLTSTMRADQ